MALYMKKTINGVSKGIPLTTDSGQGLPLGAWTSFEDDQPRNGYLKAGTTFNQADYPALYNMLGTNVVPDKGYGLDWDNRDVIPNSNYTFTKAGLFYCEVWYGTISINGKEVASGYFGEHDWRPGDVYIPVQAGDVITYDDLGHSDILYFVPYLHPMFIKAVIGPIEDSAADQVVQNINNSRSYSTEEVNTGKKWIDGKPIYRKCFTGLNVSFNTSSTWFSLGIAKPTDLNELIFGMVYGADVTSPYSNYDIPFNPISVAVGENNTMYSFSIINTGTIHKVVLEYTKTTD